MTRACKVYVVALLSLLFCARARADQSRVPARLSYAASAQCPSDNAFRHRVSELTPRVVWIASGESSKDFTIRFSVDGRGARGVLNLRSANAELLVRRLQAASCDELSEAMAIIVALILDPDAKLSPPPREPVPVESTSAETRAAPAPRPRSLRASFSPELFVVGGPTPSPAVGAALGVSVLFLERSPLQLAVRASARASRSEELSTQYGMASFSWRAMSLELCPLGSPSRRIARVEGCVTFDAGQIVASAGSNPGAEAQRTWLAPGASLHTGLYPLDFLGLEATGGASLPLIRDRFLLTPFAIHQPAALAWRAGLALSLQFF